MIRSIVRGAGSALPPRVVTNQELAAKLDTSDEWIVERTGIRQRHIAGEGETTATLATDAARAALADAGIEAGDIDLIVLATATPDNTFPATATKVQVALGCGPCAAFDVAAVCSGFLYAMSTADAMLVSGQARRALVIGAETFSRILDWEDRTTAVLFGDGAGAIVLEAQDVGDVAHNEGPGILTSQLHADGKHHDLLYVDGGPSTTQTVGHLRMKGREVFRHAVVNLAQVLNDVVEKAGIGVDQIDLVVPHQANIRIIEATAKYAGLPMEKVFVNVNRYGNMSSATVPVALDEADEKGLIGPGSNVLTVAFGSGLTWGAMALRW